jgi:hypothetical protein
VGARAHAGPHRRLRRRRRAGVDGVPGPDRGVGRAGRDPQPGGLVRLLRPGLPHHLARLALLSQQLTFCREHEELRPLETKEPFDALPLVLAVRANLTLLSESLDFSLLARHGFTRRIAEELRREMGLADALEAMAKRVQDMSTAIDLKSSVRSAQAALDRASRNNTLQTVAVVVAVLALLASLGLQIADIAMR